MTHDEIETYWRRLRKLVEKWHPTEHPKPGDVTKGDFYKLAREVGASTRAVLINPETGLPAGYPAMIDDVISNIHQALQTASMIDACRTAAKNHEIAVRAQNSARISQWIAFGAMLAAWGALTVSLILGGIGNGSWNISTGATAGTRDWTDLLAMLFAAFAVAVAVASAWIAAQQVKCQVLAELMRDYSQEDMAHAASELWRFWRDCSENKEEVGRRFGEKFEELQHLNGYRRRVSHFYQRMGGLYAMGVLPGRILYPHWAEKDLRIIPRIIIPMEEALTRCHGEEFGNELDHLKILYEESNIDGIRRAWRRQQRRLSSMASAVRGFFTRKPQVT